ncbi:hypothetical protein ABVK25_009513 [Lepraria finkii]|uniref:Uncharacterized protein n=1 Tax=Lepraria finkii TaxID=1340010 RepID=A0ABR4AWW1_9LECA
MASQLDNPSQWTTGNNAPTDKQKAFINTLASQKGASDVDPSSMNKSEASAKSTSSRTRRRRFWRPLIL